MQDRVPTKPGRVLISPENGEPEFNAVITRDDEPYILGTAWSKENVLSDETAESIWPDESERPEDPTPNEAFKNIAISI